MNQNHLNFFISNSFSALKEELFSKIEVFEKYKVESVVTCNNFHELLYTDINFFFHLTPLRSYFLTFSRSYLVAIRKFLNHPLYVNARK